MQAQNLAVDEVLGAARERFTEAMDQDLNSSGGLAVLFELAKPVRSLANRLERGEQVEDQDALKALHQRWLLLRELAAVLGLRHEPQQPMEDSNAASEEISAIDAAISARKAAKQAKDFAEADRIRAELSSQGIELIDKPGGATEWRRC